jgi:tetratricopeptide (TPR) repeat protein
MMQQNLTEWDKDIVSTAEEDYQTFLRGLSWRDGFGIEFVRCSPVGGQDLIKKIRRDLPRKKVEVLTLSEPIDNLIKIVQNLPNHSELDILFVVGLDKSLIDYIREGYGGQGEYYNLDTVPPILSHLNWQRENFRDRFPNLCFVFLLPQFAIKYIIRRAPDFYDWGLGVFEIQDKQVLKTQQSGWAGRTFPFIKRLWGDSEFIFSTIIGVALVIQLRYIALPIVFVIFIFDTFDWGSIFLRFQNKKILKKQRLGKKIFAFFKRILSQTTTFIFIYLISLILSSKPWYIGLTTLIVIFIFIFNTYFLIRSTSKFSKSVFLTVEFIKEFPIIRYIWARFFVSIEAVILLLLGRNEEAIASYDRAIEIKSDCHEVWNSRGIVLVNLGRNEEAIASYDRAIEIKSDYYEAWDNRGIALSNLGRNEEAIASYNRTVEIKPDYHEAWYARGIALSNLGRYEETISSYNRTIEIKPDYHEAWYARGIALSNLGRYEEAIASYDQALQIKPDDPSSYYNKACAYSLQNAIELALENLPKATQLDPEKYRELAKTDSDFENIRHDPRFQALIQ